MLKYLATVIFIVASLLIYRGVNGTGDLTSSRLKETVSSRFDPETARPVKRTRSAVTVVTDQQRKAAISALLEAAEVKPSQTQIVHWSEVNFKYHLAKLTENDAKDLLIKLLPQKVPAVMITNSNRVVKHETFKNWVLITETNHSKLISGLVGMLARRDFVGTVRWLESLPIMAKNSTLLRAVSSYALLAGAAQAPSEAWRVYQKNCPPWGG